MENDGANSLKFGFGLLIQKHYYYFLNSLFISLNLQMRSLLSIFVIAFLIRATSCVPETEGVRANNESFTQEMLEMLEKFWGNLSQVGNCMYEVCMNCMGVWKLEVNFWGQIHQKKVYN